MNIIMDKNNLPKPSIEEIEDRLRNNELNDNERRKLKKYLFKEKVKNFLNPQLNKRKE